MIIKDNYKYLLGFLLVVLFVVIFAYLYFFGGLRQNGDRIGIRAVSTKEKLEILNSLKSDKLEGPTTEEKMAILVKINEISNDLTADLTDQDKFNILESLKK